jgi:tripartite-type tricarboxylate transporter receptor subunit TctC
MIMVTRCTLRVAAAALACLVFGNVPAGAARNTDGTVQFPHRPIRVLVGFTPGGQPDITARVIAPKLYEALGQQVIIDNRPGAGGTIATTILAGASPDGHTLQSVSASHVIAPVIYSKLPYDPRKDLAGVTLTATASYLLTVSPSLGIRTVQELITLAKGKAGQLNFASAGSGSATHFAAEMFRFRAGMDVIHVPYKGIPEALTDTISGRVHFFMAPIGSSINLVKDGKLRALGVSSMQRARILPDIPTIAESGVPGFQWDSWAGLIAPAKTPRPIINKLHREVARALNLPDVQQRLTAIGMEPAPSTPAHFDQMIAEQLGVVADLARKAGIKPQ